MTTISSNSINMRVYIKDQCRFHVRTLARSMRCKTSLSQQFIELWGWRAYVLSHMSDNPIEFRAVLRFRTAKTNVSGRDQVCSSSVGRPNEDACLYGLHMPRVIDLLYLRPSCVIVLVVVAPAGCGGCLCCGCCCCCCCCCTLTSIFLSVVASSSVSFEASSFVSFELLCSTRVCAWT